MASNTDFTVFNGINVDTTAVISSAGVWTGPATNITGDAGFPGVAGFQGAQGAVGAQGIQGVQGSAGAAGFAGVAGTQGPQGGGGPAGFQGAQGGTGAAGFQGPQGGTGPGGPAGFQGPQGGGGPAGFQGPQGPTGFGGVSGFQGPQGPTGFASSAAGFQGPQGPTGFGGRTGFQGPQGPVGPTGPAGFQGRQGLQGQLATASIITSSGWATGSGGTTGYNQNGATAENERVNDTDPFANTAVVWETRPTGTADADGGWNTDSFAIDNTKRYRFSVWMRRTSSTSGGTFYLGVYGLDSADGNIGVKRNDNGATETNPYWECAATSKYTQNQWYLVVGHVFPLNSTETGAHPESGIYTVAGGTTIQLSLNFCNIGADVQWVSSSAARALHRTYHYYCADNTTRLQFAYPRVDVCDGTEPPINELVRAANGLVRYGPQGPQGAQGPQGGTGPQGLSGFQGPQGGTGPQGFQGVQGGTGGPGPAGFQGPQGGTGTGGTPGAQGPQGGTGPAGFQGPQGGAGGPGPSGFQGPPGPTGATGLSGFQGPQGPTGTSTSLATSVSALGINTPAGPTGELRATGNVIAYFSDIRLKDNIEYIKDAAEKLYRLNGVFYKQNELAEKFGYHDYSTQVGLIAQEVNKILPEIVKMAPFDIDEHQQSKTGENYLTIQYEKLVPLIVETIKTQQKEIEKLKNLLNLNGN